MRGYIVRWWGLLVQCNAVSGEINNGRGLIYSFEGKDVKWW